MYYQFQLVNILQLVINVKILIVMENCKEKFLTLLVE